MADLKPAAAPPPIDAAVSRVDLHCHSLASRVSKLGVQRAVGLPECATPPEEVYALAKRRGMSFVTITDHDTIAGVLEIADRPEVFVSEELSARFKGEPRAAVHVLCWGIDPDDHAWLQAHARDVERCAAYLHRREIACAVAHPFYAVEAPLAPRHRRRLAELFPVWETRNGSRAFELNFPAAVYVETHGGSGVGGSDDHAGIDVGRTFTETALTVTPADFLCEVRAGHARARGEHGGAAKWAHAPLALAARVLGTRASRPPLPATVFTMVERLMREGDARRGALGTNIGPEDGRALVRAWLDAVGLEMDAHELIRLLQADGFQHADLFRRARAAHERALRHAVEDAVDAAPWDVDAVAASFFQACLPAIPYTAAGAFLGREKRRIATDDRGPKRVALVADAIGGTHGVTRALAEIRERGVPGFEVELIGTDANVDRRLAAVAETDVPFYPGLKVGVPSLPAVLDALMEGRYDLLHVCSPGPAGVAATLVARVSDLPVLASYHTELGSYAGLRSGDAMLQRTIERGLAAFYAQCRIVLSPSAAADASLLALGISLERIARWERGVDADRFHHSAEDRRAPAKTIRVLYAGRLTSEKGIDLLAEAFTFARTRDPRLHLVLAGGGPEEEALRAALGDRASFLGWCEGDTLTAAYASSDIFLFPSRTDTFGQALLEAQASGLAVVAVAEGGPRDLVEDGQTGLLCSHDRESLAAAVLRLAADPNLRARLGRAARDAAAQRTWERALCQLAEGYGFALADSGEGLRHAA